MFPVKTSAAPSDSWAVSCLAVLCTRHQTVPVIHTHISTGWRLPTSGHGPLRVLKRCHSVLVAFPDADWFSQCTAVRLVGKFLRHRSLKIPPHLKRVITLPCEIFGIFFITSGQLSVFLRLPVYTQQCCKNVRTVSRIIGPTCLSSAPMILKTASLLWQQHHL